MRIKIHFKADNGFKPYCVWRDVPYKLCSEFGPTLKPINIGGVDSVWPLPDSIRTDMDMSEFMKIFSFKSVRITVDYPHDIIITVPGYREEWVK